MSARVPTDRAVAGRVVTRTETGYLRTTVVDRGPDAPAGSRFRWLRAPGARRPEPFRDAPAGLLGTLAAAAGPTVLLAPGRTHGDVREYDAPGAVSFAAVLASGRAGAVAGHVEQVVRHLRAALESWEAASPTAPEGLGPAPALTRLDRWLAGRPGPGASTEAAAALVTALGVDAVAEVRAWCTDLDGDVAVHGAFTSGAVVPSPGGDAPPVVLTGEEVARGRAGFDRGWLVGELDELEHHHLAGPAHDATAASLDVLRAARTVLLPPATSAVADVVARARAVRVLVHLHDFAAYVGWHDTLRGLVDLAARRVAAARRDG